MMNLDLKQLAQAVRTIAEEKNLPEDAVKEIVEQALAAAFRRDYGNREQEVRATMNLNNGDVDVYISKEVVDNVEDEESQISLTHAQAIKKNAEIGDIVELHKPVEDFGRVAAQTAKQVILQKLREAERDIVLNEYEDKIGTVINGIVTRVEARLVRLDLGKAQGILPASEQIQNEHYYPGQRIKVFLKDVEKSNRGPQLVVSRGSVEFIKDLFSAEVPEMDGGAVEIKAIVREAGVRTKLAVASSVQGVDPVGTFVGGHGTRVNAVMSEIGDQEKIDIIVWDEDPKKFIMNAMSPLKSDQIISVTIDEKTQKATVKVPSDQQSIAIGRSGQNVRLASKISGFEIDIVGADGDTKPKQEDTPKTEIKPVEHKPEKKPEKNKLKRKSELESDLLSAIEEHGE